MYAITHGSTMWVYFAFHFVLLRHLSFDCNCFYKVKEWWTAMAKKTVQSVCENGQNSFCSNGIFNIHLASFLYEFVYVFVGISHFPGVVQIPTRNKLVKLIFYPFDKKYSYLSIHFTNSIFFPVLYVGWQTFCKHFFSTLAGKRNFVQTKMKERSK